MKDSSRIDLHYGIPNLKSTQDFQNLFTERTVLVKQTQVCSPPLHRNLSLNLDLDTVGGQNITWCAIFDFCRPEPEALQLLFVNALLDGPVSRSFPVFGTFQCRARNYNCTQLFVWFIPIARLHDVSPMCRSTGIFGSRFGSSLKHDGAFNSIRSWPCPFVKHFLTLPISYVVSPQDCPWGDLILMAPPVSFSP